MDQRRVTDTINNGMERAKALNPNMDEGRITRTVESVTGRVPSIGYLGLAVGSIVASAALRSFSRKTDLANFVGLWAPTFMMIGIYNKLVKMDHHQSHSSAQS